MPGKVAEAPALEAIAFIDLEAQRQRLGGRTATAISRVLGHGKFIMGPEVAELETELAEFTGRRHAITCASGTDALILPLMAKGIGPGDAVFVPAFTFAATAEAVAQVGATPVFVDVRAETFNLDPESLSAALSVAQENGLTPRAAIAVDLFGQPADYGAINAIASAADLWVLADAAQSFGSSLGGVRAGSLGDIDATSFFPSKPLGCYGDGGAVFTDDDDKAALIRSIRVHGSGENKYDAARIGLNSRLDTLQAAILLQKLAIFDDEIRQRQVVAERYRERPWESGHDAPRQGSPGKRMGSIHDPQRSPRRHRHASARQGYPDGDLLPQTVAPTDGVPGLSGRTRRRADQRRTIAHGAQPAHAPLSRRSRAGSHRWRGTGCTCPRFIHRTRIMHTSSISCATTLVRR